MRKWGARILGFVIAVALCYLLAFGFFALLNDATGKHYMPRGIGWLLGPLAAGMAGARFAETGFPRLLQRPVSFRGPLRFYAAGSLVWIVAVWCYVFIFDPFGSYWSSSDWSFLWKLMLTPIAFAALCGGVIHWLRPSPR